MWARILKSPEGILLKRFHFDSEGPAEMREGFRLKPGTG